jgi:hypothetical protein
LGVVTDIDGAFFCTGELQIGNGAAATDFDMDGNVLIYTDQEVNAGLYRFVIDGTGVNAELRNSLFQSTGTTDDTRFIFDLSADNFTLTNVGCVLQRAAAISFGSSQTINSWTFTDCFAITTNGATLSECTINDTASTSAVVVSNLSQVDACVFTGDNTSHAVELTTVATNGETQTWNCSATGYTSGSPATVTTTNNDAHILVTASTSNDLTISVSAGATIPSVKLDAAYTGTVTVQSGLATLTISGVIAGSDVVIYTAGSITKLQDDQDISGTTSTYTYTFSAGTFVDIKVYAEGYTPFFIYGFELGSASATLPVAQQLDRNYVP